MSNQSLSLLWILYGDEDKGVWESGRDSSYGLTGYSRFLRDWDRFDKQASAGYPDTCVAWVNSTVIGECKKRVLYARSKKFVNLFYILT